MLLHPSTRYDQQNQDHVCVPVQATHNTGDEDDNHESRGLGPACNGRYKLWSWKIKWTAWWFTPNWRAIPHVLLCGSCVTISWTIYLSAGVQQVHSWPLSINSIGRTLPISFTLWSSQWNTFAFVRQHAKYLCIFPGCNISRTTTCTTHQLHITIFVQGVLHLISPSLLMDYCHVQLHSTHCVLPQCCLLAIVVSTVCDLHLSPWTFDADTAWLHAHRIWWYFLGLYLSDDDFQGIWSLYIFVLFFSVIHVSVICVHNFNHTLYITAKTRHKVYKVSRISAFLCHQCYEHNILLWNNGLFCSVHL
jgi:hypothetical protein